MAKQYDLLISVILIGDTGVGKTCLLCRFVDDQFQANCAATVGIDFKVKTISVNNKRVRLQIWDTAGQERFETLTTQYYRRAQGVLLVYDISNENTFRSLPRWVAFVKQFCKENVEISLVGNKIDLEEWRQVSKTDGLAFAEKHKFPFSETSSYGEHSLDKVFNDLIQRVFTKHSKELTRQKLQSFPSTDSDGDTNSAPLYSDSDSKFDQRLCCHSL